MDGNNLLQSNSAHEGLGAKGETKQAAGGEGGGGVDAAEAGVEEVEAGEGHCCFGMKKGAVAESREDIVSTSQRCGLKDSREEAGRERDVELGVSFLIDSSHLHRQPFTRYRSSTHPISPRTPSAHVHVVFNPS